MQDTSATVPRPLVMLYWAIIRVLLGAAIFGHMIWHRNKEWPQREARKRRDVDFLLFLTIARQVGGFCHGLARDYVDKRVPGSLCGSCPSFERGGRSGRRWLHKGISGRTDAVKGRVPQHHDRNNNSTHHSPMTPFHCTCFTTAYRHRALLCEITKIHMILPVIKAEFSYYSAYYEVFIS